MTKRTILLVVAMLLFASATATAQTGRRISVGAGPSWRWYTDNAFSRKNPGISLMYRFSWKPHTHNGWHMEPGVTFTWGHADFGPEVGGSDLKLGSLRSIPVLVGGGPAYRHDRWKLGISLEGGPSFHTFTVDNAARAPYEDRTGNSLESISSKTSFAGRLGVGLWRDLSTRLGARTGISYVYERPDISTTAGGVTTSEKWKEDYVSASVGLVVGFF